MAPIRLLIDANVILDVLYNRKPFADASARVLEFCRGQREHSFVSAHAVTTIFYLYRKYKNAETARAILMDLLQVLSVAAVGQEVIERAVRMPYRDFEDAVTMMVATQAGAEYLITRNRDDFEHGPLPVVTPEELLARL